LFVDFFIHRPVLPRLCAADHFVGSHLPPASSRRDVPDPDTSTGDGDHQLRGRQRRHSGEAVTIPLEEAINGVEGMRYISSSSTNSGTSSITTTFTTGYNLDIAAVDVQNRVASVQGRLPSAVECQRYYHHQG